MRHLKRNKFAERILRGESILSFRNCCRSTERGRIMGPHSVRGSASASHGIWINHIISTFGKSLYAQKITLFPFGQCVPGLAFRHVFGNGTLQREIQDCPNCPTMIVVPGGTFWMGKTTLKALPTRAIRSLWVILPSASLKLPNASGLG